MRQFFDFINVYASLDKLVKIRLHLSFAVCCLYSLVGVYVTKMYFQQINVVLLKAGDIYDYLIGVILGTIVLSKVKYLVTNWKIIFFIDAFLSLCGLVIILIDTSNMFWYYIVMTFFYGFLRPVMNTIDNREDTALFWGKQKMFEDYRNCARQINLLGCLFGSLLCMLFQHYEIITEKNEIAIFLLFHLSIFISLYRDYYIRNHINMNCVEENTNISKLDC